MARDPRDLLKEALELSQQARARLAAELLRSLDEEEPLDPSEYEALWGPVIERRIRELEDGSVTPIPWSDARQQIAS